jgi:hypothetical protein
VWYSCKLTGHNAPLFEATSWDRLVTIKSGLDLASIATFRNPFLVEKLLEFDNNPWFISGEAGTICRHEFLMVSGTGNRTDSSRVSVLILSILFYIY